ncbi:cysteine hydrolase family protein [Pseudomonas sp. PS02288]|uniref:cysteine hydrolase family protein n=1 Tax=Pseudomonas sp. PS02288 TaxID=2991443 RepID=UPI002499F80E|nr:cysteine hydrolase family protein [Pseudomonas sp. PS02288]
MSASPNRALIVIDVQNEYITGNLRIEYPDVGLSLPNIARAMDAARATGIPVVVIQHLEAPDSPLFARGGEMAELHPDIARRPRDHHVEKNQASALTGTDLAAWLRDRQIDTLTVIGYMTHNCDLATTLEAHHLGWNVELLHDASGSLPYSNACGSVSAEEIHRVMTVVMHSSFAAVASTAQWLEALENGTALEPGDIPSSNQRAIAERQ